MLLQGVCYEVVANASSGGVALEVQKKFSVIKKVCIFANRNRGVEKRFFAPN
jgi:hypothetical protein